MQPTNKQTRTKVWGLLAAIVALGSIAGIAAANGSFDAYIGAHGSSSTEGSQSEYASGDWTTDAGMHAEVSETLNASNEVRDSLEAASTVASELEAHGLMMFEHAQGLEGQARADAQDHARAIIDTAERTQQELDNSSEATFAATMDLKWSAENDSAARVQWSLQQTIEVSEEAKTTLERALEAVEDIRSEAQATIDASFDATNRTSAVAKAQVESDAQSVVSASEEFKEELEALLSSVGQFESQAQLTLSISAPGYSGSANGGLSGQVDGDIGSVAEAQA